MDKSVKDFQGIASARLWVNPSKVTASQAADVELTLSASSLENTYELGTWYSMLVTLWCVHKAERDAARPI